MTQLKSKTIFLKLSEDEIETVIIALMESKLPKSKDDGWNEESQKVFQKIQKQSWEQR
jgi:hypothetical protein